MISLGSYKPFITRVILLKGLLTMLMNRLLNGMILQVFQDTVYVYMTVKSIEYGGLECTWNTFVNCKLLSGSPRFFPGKDGPQDPFFHLKKIEPRQVFRNHFTPSFRATKSPQRCLGSKTAISWMDFGGHPGTKFRQVTPTPGTLKKHRFPVFFGGQTFLCGEIYLGLLKNLHQFSRFSRQKFRVFTSWFAIMCWKSSLFSSSEKKKSTPSDPKCVNSQLENRLKCESILPVSPNDSHGGWPNMQWNGTLHSLSDGC